MTTKYQFIEFKPWGNHYVCLSLKPVASLGIVEFYQPWKQWQFCPNGSSAFTIECLRDIAAFMSQLNGIKVV